MMGRKKRYVTKKQKRDNNREKSNRYYQNHSADILKKLRDESNSYEYDDFMAKQSIVDRDEDDYFKPEKVTLGFVWFCFSKLTDEEIRDNLEDFRGHFYDVLTNYYNHEDDKKKKDSYRKPKTIKQTTQDKAEVEKKIDKKHKEGIERTIKQLQLTPEDWKNQLGLNKWDLN